MTKSLHKLVLRKETLRALNTVDLTRVVGGAGSNTIPVAVDKTHDVLCPLQADITTPGK
jgi:hypothetical protein